jgi:chromatin segregation and condensation protein Rec8/ScpA/Scc1 (kleisin family)
MIPATSCVNARELVEIIKKINARAVCHTTEERMVKKTFATLEETIQKLLQRIEGEGLKNFGGAIQGKNRDEIIVLFLALVHLAHLGKLAIHQEKEFGDIIMTRH